MNLNPTKGPMVSLPLAAFELTRSPMPTQIERGFAAGGILMVLVLVLFTLARVLGGRPAGHLSKRQARRSVNRSLRRLGAVRTTSRGARVSRCRPAASFRRSLLAMALVVIVVTVLLSGGQAPSTANAQRSYQRISGEGSSWAANAIDAMRVNIRQFGITVDYNPSGSTAGRKNFLNGTVDFAASDIPFQFQPEDGSAPENPAPGSYAYIPSPPAARHSCTT